MSEIYVKENESLDNALKRFKRSCAKSGVLADLRKKEYYQSPSVKRRKKSEAARNNKNKRYYYSVSSKPLSCDRGFVLEHVPVCDSRTAEKNIPEQMLRDACCYDG